jgi:branched-chain amino acid transport system permease protein
MDFMTSRRIGFACDGEHGPKIFRCGESTAANSFDPRAWLDLRHCFTGADAIGNHRFVDSEPAFRLNRRDREASVLISRTAREHKARQRQSLELPPRRGGMLAMLDFVQQVVSGIALGCVYGLIALGFVLVYKATEVVNFAQGDLMMLGGFFAFTFIGLLGFNYWIGFAAAVVSMALFGMLAERLVVRPILGYPQFSIIMATIGLGYFLRSVVGMIWGTDDFKIETPFSQGVLRIGSLVLAYDKLSVIAATIILCAMLYMFFNRTMLGTAMRASSENMLAAYYMGIPVKRVVSIVWAISAAVATCAGVLLAPITFIHSNVGLVLGLKAFPAAVLGGFGSIPGAVVGGVLIGVIESMAGFYLAEGWKDVAPYVVLLIVLLLKPEGLFGLHMRKKV